MCLLDFVALANAVGLGMIAVCVCVCGLMVFCGFVVCCVFRCFDYLL